jgi:hypothetical protein
VSKTWYGHNVENIKGEDYVLFKDYLELDKEIERLNNIINELERYLEDEKINLDDYLGCLDDEERHYEIARLTPRYNDFKEIYDRLRELKGDSSNE